MSIRSRMTKSKTQSRRAHHALEGARLGKDKEGALHLRHHASPETGRYRGRVVIDFTAKLAKAERKRKEREREEAQLGKTTPPEEEEVKEEGSKPLDATELSKK